MKTAKIYPTQEQLHDMFVYSDGELFWKNDTIIKDYYFRGKLVQGKVQKKAGRLAGTTLDTGYKQIKIDGSFYYTHRLIYIYHNGQIENDMKVIHKDHNQRNNCIDNLILATAGEARAFGSVSKQNKSSQYRGVSFTNIEKPWLALIRVNNKNMKVGQFRTEEEAARAFDAAAVHHRGDIARVNFPDEWPGYRKIVKVRKNAASQYVGVSLAPKVKIPWRAAIRNGPLSNLGNYSNEEDAARAYDKAAYEIYGKFATLNFPDEIDTTPSK